MHSNGRTTQKVFCFALRILKFQTNSFTVATRIRKNQGIYTDKQTELATYHPSPQSVELEDPKYFLKALQEESNCVFFLPCQIPIRMTTHHDSNSRNVAQNPDRSIAFPSLGVQDTSRTSIVVPDVGTLPSLVRIPSFTSPLSYRIDKKVECPLICQQLLRNKNDIKQGLKLIFSQEITKKQNSVNPYEKENTAQNIFNILQQ
jgi:hypothetical protein